MSIGLSEEFTPINEHAQPKGYRSMWIKTLIAALEAAEGRGDHLGGVREPLRRKIIQTDREWIGSKDFYEVCAHADMNPDMVLEAYNSRVFKERIATMGARRGGNHAEQEQIVLAALRKTGPISGNNLAKRVQGVSRYAAQATLSRLQEAGKVECTGTGITSLWEVV